MRKKIENVAIYWPQANIENFSFLSCFLLAYLRFSDVEFFKFIAKIKRLLLKMVSLKFLYMKNVHKNPIMKVWTNIVFSAAPKFTKQAFLYYLTYSVAPLRLLCYGLKTRDFPLTGSFQLWKFILELSIIESRCDILNFVQLNPWASYEFWKFDTGLNWKPKMDVITWRLHIYVHRWHLDVNNNEPI